MKEEGMKNLIALFFEFFKIGMFTIGGGLAMIPLLEKTVVEKKGWLSKEEMMNCIAISQSVPGVMAVNMATYIGYKKHGFWGSLFAVLGVVMPSYIIIMIVVNVVDLISDNPYFQGALMGVKAGLCGLIIGVIYRMCKHNLKSAFACIVAAASFVAIAFGGVNGIIVVVGAAILGVCYSFTLGKFVENKDEKGGIDDIS